MRILNAFSFNMVEAFPAEIIAEELSLEAARAKVSKLDIESAVGHTDTARVFTSELGVEVPANRTSVTLTKGDIVLVGQYRGPRLEEGATNLPSGATIKWLLVSVR